MSKNSKFVIAGVVLLLAVIAASVSYSMSKDDDTPTTTTTSSTKIGQSSTTASSAPSTMIDPAVITSAIWPSASSNIRITDPQDAARRFAIEFAGFKSPIVGSLQQGDSRSGEVAIRPVSKGPVTTVLVRQLGSDNAWWVIGATTSNIQISEPAALAKVASPVTLKGRSTAFEANVQTEIRQDNSSQPLGEGFVMGGSNGEIGPFNGTLKFSQPTAKYGTIMLRTKSAENGQVWEVAAVRVAF